LKTKVWIHRVSCRFSANYSNDSYDGLHHSPSEGLLTDLRSSATWNNTVTFGNNFPNWKQLIEDDINATTTMDGSVTRWITVQDGIGHSEWKYAPSLSGAYEYRSAQFGGTYAPWNPLTPPLAIPTSSYSAEQRALARFNAKAAEANRQFQGGVFFAELGKTLHGIAHPAEALFKGLNAYFGAATKLRRSIIKDRATYLALSKSRRRQVAKATTKAVTGLWLEQSFHWLPLMYDIQGAVSAYLALSDRWPTTFVKVSATVKESETATPGELSVGEGITFPYVDHRSAGASVRMYGKVRIGHRDPVLPDLKAIGFDIRSFLPTVWELIPYSWAVDYFTNIGDMLYAASYGSGDIQWASIGIKRFSNCSCTLGVSNYLMKPPSGWTNVLAYAVMKPSVVALEKAVISRAQYTGNFIPLPDLKVPGLSSLKWLNLGAAFLQRSLAFL
jgi:hypothetical protein